MNEPLIFSDKLIQMFYIIKKRFLVCLDQRNIARDWSPFSFLLVWVIPLWVYICRSEEVTEEGRDQVYEVSRERCQCHRTTVSNPFNWSRTTRKKTLNQVLVTVKCTRNVIMKAESTPYTGGYRAKSDGNEVTRGLGVSSYWGDRHCHYSQFNSIWADLQTGIE